MDRFALVDRVAEAVFVALHEGKGHQAAYAPILFAKVAYEAANAFYCEREKRHGEWRAALSAEDPLALENHDFQPAQGDSEKCLVCAKWRGLHEKNAR